MNTTTELEVTSGHLDQRESLLPLLAGHVRPEPLQGTLAEFDSWTTAERRRFNERRLARMANAVVVPIPPLAELLRQVRLASFFAERAVGRTGVFLSGPAAMGKTTTAFHAMVQALQRHANRYPNWRELNHTPVVYVEVASNSTAKAFMGRLLNFFGVPFGPRTTLEERTQMVMHQLQHGRTSLIVIDEMQNLSRLNDGNFESAQAIKNMTNGARAVPLYVGMNLDQTVLLNGELGAQFAARSTLVKLGPLGFSTAQERAVWRGAIRTFEEQLPLLNHTVGTLDAHAEDLWTVTSGSIGALSRLLNTAALTLILDDNPQLETITPECLSLVKLDVITERTRDEGSRQEKGRRRAA